MPVTVTTFPSTRNFSASLAVSDAQVVDGALLRHYANYYVEYSTSMARRKGETFAYHALPFLDCFKWPVALFPVAPHGTAVGLGRGPSLGVPRAPPKWGGPRECGRVSGMRN